MFSLVPDLYAMSSPSDKSGGMSSLIMFGLIFVIFFFFIIRPQQKKAKKQRTMLGDIQKGDQVVTGSGIFGTVNKCFDTKNYVLLEIADKTIVKILKNQISDVIKSKGEKATETDKK
jgi:preprotein translocase subunit YajC